LKSLDAAEIAAAKKTEEHFIANDLTAINIVRQVAAGFEANSAPVSSEVICSKLDIPGEFGSRVLDHLVATGILIKSTEPRAGYIPAQDPANIKLSEIADAVAKAGFGQPEELDQITQSQRSVLAQYNLKQILDPQETT
jgi:DNA-binding IscR family transcriptional regulator